jgi:hypothetical protein
MVLSQELVGAGTPKMASPSMICLYFLEAWLLIPRGCVKTTSSDQVPMAHACNPSYSKGRDPSQGNSL